MQEIAEITEIAMDDDPSQKKNKSDTKDDIEVGLEIVALEMGNILEELKDNLENLLWQSDKKTPLTQAKAKKAPKSTKKEQKPVPLQNKGSSNPRYQVQKSSTSTQNIHNNNTKINNNNNKKNSSSFSAISVSKRSSREIQRTDGRQTSRSLSSGRRTSSATGNQLSTTKTSSSVRATARPDLTSHDLAQIRKRYSSLTRPYNHNEQLQILREQVENAIRDKKIFTVCGNYYAIRRALLTRGWIEKVRISYNTNDRENLQRLQSSSLQELLDGLQNPQTGYIYKRMILSKLIGQQQADFYWDLHFDCFRVCRDNVKFTIINRFRRGIFGYTSKQGLCENIKTAYWFQKPGVVDIKHPRSYNLSNADDPKDFINDFKLTAAMSLLKWVVYNVESRHPTKIITADGKVPLKIFAFAVDEVLKIVRKCKHEDIDYEIEEAIDYQWNEFLEYFYKIVHIGNHFKSDGKETGQTILHTAKCTIERVKKFWPHMTMDGVMNIWILKPTNGSRGEGIYLCRTLQYILKILKSNTTRRYIVQKYIERPLLIHNTKFDIRQWFLISSSVPLTIWIYKDCYIRFSSQLYNLHKLHESIHLTNNSIQCRYHNCRRSSALPACNMWDSNEFQKYLKSIGHPTAFSEKIYPGMKQCITAAILMNQCNIDTRKNCFELYGSDFMVTEDFQPWLIEINTRPALYPSTPVTARMCPQVLEDLIRVIIDNAKNPKASTGRFELLYREKLEKLPRVKSNEFELTGKQLPTSYFYTPQFSTDGQLQCSGSSKSQLDCTHYNIKELSCEMKKTLENLLSIIHAERERRKQLQNKFSQASEFTEIFTNLNLTENGDDIEEEIASIASSDSKEDDNDEVTRETNSEFNNNTMSGLEVNVSAAQQILKARSDEVVTKQFLAPHRTLPVDEEIQEALREPGIIKSVPKNIFKNLIESVRNNSYILTNK